MFRRVILEDWQEWVPYASTGVLFFIYFVMVIWALLMRKPRAEKMANLPIENQEIHSNQSH